MSKATTRKARIAATIAAAAVVAPSVFGIATPASAAPSVVPTITKLSVVAGLTDATTNVLITGKNFSSVTTTSTNVKFGAADAKSFIVLSDTQIAAVAETGHAAGMIQVVVHNPIGDSLNKVSDDFTFVTPFTTATATVQKLNPFGGTPIVATTSASWTDLAGFKAAKITATVDGVKANVAYKTATTATITAPAGAAKADGTAAVVLLVKNGVSSTDAGSAAAKYVSVITKLSKTSGPMAGTGTLTVTGKGFTDATAWQFGLKNLSVTLTPVASVPNTATCTIVNDTTATCTIPAAPTTQVGGVQAAVAGSVSVSFVPDNSAGYAALPGATYTYTDIG